MSVWLKCARLFKLAPDGQAGATDVGTSTERGVSLSACVLVSLRHSDGREVLFKHHGLDPQAAQLLDKALWHECNGQPPDTTPAQGRASQAGGTSRGTFLGALLGPELEAAALRTVEQRR